MEKVRFNLVYSMPGGGYTADKTGDKSGEYVRAGFVAEELLAAAKKAVQAMMQSNCDSQAQDGLAAAIANAEK